MKRKDNRKTGLTERQIPVCQGKSLDDTPQYLQNYSNVNTFYENVK